MEGTNMGDAQRSAESRTSASNELLSRVQQQLARLGMDPLPNNTSNKPIATALDFYSQSLQELIELHNRGAPFPEDLTDFIDNIRSECDVFWS